MPIRWVDEDCEFSDLVLNECRQHADEHITLLALDSSGTEERICRIIETKNSFPWAEYPKFSRVMRARDFLEIGMVDRGLDDHYSAYGFSAYPIYPDRAINSTLTHHLDEMADQAQALEVFLQDFPFRVVLASPCYRIWREGGGV